MSDTSLKKVCLRLSAAIIMAILPGRSISYGQQVTDSVTVNVRFKQNVSILEQGFGSNRTALRTFLKEYNRLSNDPNCSVVSVELISGASPEGAADHNQDLSEKRASALRQYLENYCDEVSSELLVERPLGSDWAGLADRIEKTEFSWKEEAASIIRETPLWISDGSRIVDGKKKRIMEFRGGEPWKWMEENIFPDLRASAFKIIYRHDASYDPDKACVGYQSVQQSARDTLVIEKIHKQVDTVYVIGAVATAAEEKRTVSRNRRSSNGDGIKQKYNKQEDRRLVMALRTNTLAIPLANFGLEFPLGERWSVGADYYYPWIWRDSVHKLCNEMLAWDAELRYWFPGKRAASGKRLLGSSIGIYGAGGYYDFERDWSGLQGEFYTAGLDYTYALALGRGGVHLEFELGVGYLFSPTRKYNVYMEGGKLFKSENFQRNFSFIGPTKAGVSLAIPIYGKKKTKEADNEQ